MNLSKHDLIDLWENGILSPLAFICLAIKHDALNEQPFDMDNFIFNWRGSANPDTGRVKTLSKKQVLSAIATLEEKDQITIDKLSVQLSIFECSPGLAIAA